MARGGGLSTMPAIEQGGIEGIVLIRLAGGLGCGRGSRLHGPGGPTWRGGFVRTSLHRKYFTEGVGNRAMDEVLEERPYERPAG